MSLKIIDCTLREGSNVINFQFGRKLTINILKGLESAGVQWIEMGHGYGLSATSKCNFPALLSDEEYMDLAKSCLKVAKYGFHFNLKYSEKKDIKISARKGVHFLRIGTEIDRVNEIKEYINLAKENGLLVFVSLRKIYAISGFREYVKILKKLENWGADLIILLDSAGYMMPKDVKKIINLGKTAIETSLGFHAHNNLQLGIANTITAIESGVDSVDACVGGIGRSSGNIPIEILSIILEKYHWETSLDYKKLSDLNDKYIFPLIKGKNRFSSKNLLSGLTGFHSGYFPLINKAIKKYPHIDYRDLIIAISKKEKINITERLVEDTIEKLLEKHKSQ